jgi:hypothetical protein
MRIHSYIHAYIYHTHTAKMFTCIHASTRTHTQMCTHTHTHTHKSTHTRARRGRQCVHIHMRTEITTCVHIQAHNTYTKQDGARLTVQDPSSISKSGACINSNTQAARHTALQHASFNILFKAIAMVKLTVTMLGTASLGAIVAVSCVSAAKSFMHGENNCDEDLRRVPAPRYLIEAGGLLRADQALMHGFEHSCGQSDEVSKHGGHSDEILVHGSRDSRQFDTSGGMKMRLSQRLRNAGFFVPVSMCMLPSSRGVNHEVS